VQGKIIKVHTKDVEYKGHTHRCSVDDPQYEIKSDKTDHVAMHKGAALTKIYSFAAFGNCRGLASTGNLSEVNEDV